jgi:hypothetical protein
VRLAVIASLAMACGSPPPVEAPRAPPPKSAATIVAPRVRVHYRGEWPRYVALLGTRGDRAWLRVESTDAAWIDTIELSSGKRIERWESTNATKVLNAHGTFEPWTGSFESDLVRYAAMVRDVVDPLDDVVRSTADGTRLFFHRFPDNGTDGDWWYITGGDGRTPRRFDLGLIASYRLMLSPDGAWAAWSGTAQSWHYALWARPTDESAPPKKLGAVAFPRELAFVDARTVAVHARGPAQDRSCLFVANVETGVAKSVHCAMTSDDSAMVFSPDRKLAVLNAWATKGYVKPRKSTLLRVADGGIVGERELPTGAFDVLTNDGLMLFSDHGLRVIDLAHGHDRTIPSDGGLEFWTPGAVLTSGRTLLVLRHTGTVFELVSVDL